VPDPTIPRSPQPPGRKRKAFPRVGWFARTAGGSLFLESNRGNRWTLDFVSILQGTWGSIDNSEGVTKLPRPREYDKDGKVVVEGDRVVIDFLEGDPSMPIVRGGVRGVRTNDFFPYNQSAAAADFNRLGGRLCPLDSEGKAKGVVEWEAAYGDQAAVRVSVIEAGDAPVAGQPPAGARTYMALEPGVVQAATAAGETFRMAEGQIVMITAAGHTIMIDPENGVQIAQAKPPAVEGGPPEAEAVIQLKDGVAMVLGTGSVQLVGTSIELGNGVLPPGDKYILSGAFLADLAVVLNEIVVGIGTAPSGVAPLTTQMALDIGTSLAAGPPFLSNLVKGQ
jgi:hypothetical protein